MFGAIIEETIRDIEDFKRDTLSRVRNSYSKEFEFEGFEREFKDLSNEWDKSTAGQIAKLNVVLELVQKKREQVESLRDGVSTSISPISR
jgi:hypothetical protein